MTQRLNRAFSPAAVIGAALVASTALAAVVSEFANGLLIPMAYFRADNSTFTAVGLNTCSEGQVYWTFFDPNSKHVVDGDFSMTANQQQSFLWNQAQGFESLADRLGYLVFTLDTPHQNQRPNGALDVNDVPCLSGAAFQVEPLRGRVSYLPALPLQAKNPSIGFPNTASGGDFGPADANGVFLPNLMNLNNTSVVNLNAGAKSGDRLYLRYFVGSDSQSRTDIYLWSAQDLSGRYSWQLYNTNQQRFSSGVTLSAGQLNVITLDPSNGRDDLVRPRAFVDGFAVFDLGSPDYTYGVERGRPTRFGSEGAASYGDGVVSWSIIDTPTAGTQTIVNPMELTAKLSPTTGRVMEQNVRLRCTEGAGDVCIQNLRCAAGTGAVCLTP